MRVPRFRIRTLMIAVAVVGVVLGAVKLHQRRILCLQMVAFYREREELLIAVSERHLATIAEIERTLNELAEERRSFKDQNDKLWQSFIEIRRKTDAMRPESASFADRAARYAALRRQYERAARHPWLPIPPEPD
jgi:hypothetical protein